MDSTDDSRRCHHGANRFVLSLEERKGITGMPDGEAAGKHAAKSPLAAEARLTIFYTINTSA